MAGKKESGRLAVGGFRAAGIACGVKKGGRKDLALIVSDVPSSVAGVFTKNSVKAAPVIFDIGRVKKGFSRGVIVNSGNANACTGAQGLKAAKTVAAAAEKAMGFKGGSLLVASTGVIGVPLPADRIAASLKRLYRNLSPSGWMDAAEAIMTTDAFPKVAYKKKRIEGKQITLLGIAKGAGMICPSMATMLAFFATDAAAEPADLKKALKDAADSSFNRITVDNDTSTNDTVLIFANGWARGNPLRARGKGFALFSELLNEVSLELSHMIVRDGEGATRFIAMEVRGGATEKEAELGARKIAGSLLVKTAFFGGDPNWGRLMAALGSSGIRVRPEKVDIYLNGVGVVKNGIDTGAEKKAAEAIKRRDVEVVVDLKLGEGVYKLWTTDLSYDYVRINSSYRS